MNAEFRINDHRRWEDIPARQVQVWSEGDAQQIAVDLAKETGEKVRWNWKGSLQGHYAEPPDQ